MKTDGEQRIITDSTTLLQRLLAAVAKTPECVRVQVDSRFAGMLEVRIQADKDDVPRFVGTGGSMVKEIASMARMLFFQTRRRVRVVKIEPVSARGQHHGNGDLRAFCDLLADVVECVADERPVMKVQDDNHHVLIQPHLARCDRVVERLGQALHAIVGLSSGGMYDRRTVTLGIVEGVAK